MVPEGWRLEALGDLVSFVSGGTPNKSCPEYWGGDIPWITAKDLKSFRISNSKDRVTKAGCENGTRTVPAGTVLMLVRGMGLLKDIPLGVTAREVAFNQDIKALRTSDDLLAEFLAYALDSQKPLIMRMVTLAGHGTGRLETESIAALSISVPPIREQKNIISVLRTTDLCLEQVDQLTCLKKALKLGLAQQLLTGKRRFCRFIKSDQSCTSRIGPLPVDWPLVEIEQIAQQLSDRPRDFSSLTVLSCTKHRGLVDSLEYFGKKVYSDITSEYKLVRRGQFAYATNHLEEGSIGLLDHRDSGLVSPMYTVFEVSDRVYAPFLYALFKTELYRHLFCANTNASVNRRGGLRWTQFAKLPVPLPELDEQKAIATLLSDSNRQIELLKCYRNVLTKYRDWLMRKLLNGEVRTADVAGKSAVASLGHRNNPLVRNCKR